MRDALHDTYITVLISHSCHSRIHPFIEALGRLAFPTVLQ